MTKEYYQWMKRRLLQEIEANERLKCKRVADDRRRRLAQLKETYQQEQINPAE